MDEYTRTVLSRIYDDIKFYYIMNEGGNFNYKWQIKWLKD